MHNTLHARCTFQQLFRALCCKHDTGTVICIIYGVVFAFVPLQYVVAGVWKGFGVAIRVTKQDILDETGLQFIRDAIDILK